MQQRLPRTKWAAIPASLLLSASPALAQFSQGADVTYSDITSASTWVVGSVRAYAYDSFTCNRGNVNLLWTNNGTPGLAMNLYRLHGGRLEQIGQSWVKTACCAAASTGCGLTCNGQGNSVLGAGCRDVYSSGWNGSQNRLMPRSQINPWTGQFGTIPGGTPNAIGRRLQVPTSDLQLSNFPGALYFAEGVYVASDETNVVNKMNNASYRPATINQSTFQMNFTGTTRVGFPAIHAWRDHGLGLNNPDTSVVLQTVDVPGEGRFHVAHKVTQVNNNTWRYEYAVFNLNSHVSGGSLTIPVPEGVTVTNAGFHDVDYHSGEPYDNTDWVIDISGSGITWRSPQTFEQNPNSNALRWGTMYNFWFDANTPPVEGQATLGLFRPHTPSSVSFAAAVPDAGSRCATDWDGNSAVNSADISAFLGAWLDSLNLGTLAADFNGDQTVNSADISAFLAAWIEEVTIGC